MIFTKADLLFKNYTWTSVNNQSITNTLSRISAPERQRDSRHHNRIMKAMEFCSTISSQKIERLIRKHVPHERKSRTAIIYWIKEHF